MAAAPLPQEMVDLRERLRRRMRARRAALSAAAQEQAAQGLRAHGLALFAQLAAQGVPLQVVAGYVPVRGEADVLPLLQALHARGHEIALPVVARRAAPLIFRRWQPGAPLEEGAYGIPAPPRLAPQVVPDVLLVPLVAFDAQGARLGYGGGYYDRTLAALRRLRPVMAIGCAHAWQQAPAIPALATDERLDAILTDAGVIHARRQSG